MILPFDFLMEKTLGKFKLSDLRRLFLMSVFFRSASSLIGVFLHECNAFARTRNVSVYRAVKLDADSWKLVFRQLRVRDVVRGESKIKKEREREVLFIKALRESASL